MAQVITCDNLDGNEAALIIGNTATGEQLAVCAACAPQTLLTLAESFVPSNAVELPGAAVQSASEQEGEGAGEQPAPPHEGPQSEAQPPAGADGDEPAAPDGAAAADDG